MTIKNINLFDSEGNDKGTYDVFMISDLLFEFFYPKSSLELNKDDQIIIPLHNEEEMLFKIVSFEFIEQHFDIPEHYIATTQIVSFPKHLEKVS